MSKILNSIRTLMIQFSSRRSENSQWNLSKNRFPKLLLLKINKIWLTQQIEHELQSWRHLDMWQLLQCFNISMFRQSNSQFSRHSCSSISSHESESNSESTEKKSSRISHGSDSWRRQRLSCLFSRSLSYSKESELTTTNMWHQFSESSSWLSDTAQFRMSMQSEHERFFQSSMCCRW